MVLGGKTHYPLLIHVFIFVILPTKYLASKLNIYFKEKTFFFYTIKCLVYKINVCKLDNQFYKIKHLVSKLNI